MKNLYLSLFTIALALGVTQLSAQLSFNVFSGEDACSQTSLTLNGADDLTEDNCAYSTDFSNVQSGDNVIEVSTDLSPLFATSTLDLVYLMRYIDEGFESYAQAMAADFNGDLTISTDDIIDMRRIILGIDSEIPTKVKLATVDQVFEPMVGLDLISNHTSLSIPDTELQDGVPTEIVLVIVGNF